HAFSPYARFRWRFLNRFSRSNRRSPASRITIFKPGTRSLNFRANSAAVMPPPMTHTSLSCTGIGAASSERRGRALRIAQAAAGVSLHSGAVAEVVGLAASEVERHQIAD